MNKLLAFAQHVLQEQQANGASGDAEYIRMAEEAIEAEMHNGWPNRETWAVYMHITNDQELYNYFTDFADQVRACRCDFPVQAIADKCEDWFESQRGLMIDGSCHRDTAAALTDIGSLWRVDWDAVAKALSEGGVE